MAIPNQSPNSSVAGTLQPAEPPPANGQIAAGETLEDYLQQWVAATAYLEETLVRPRWQLIPANIPDVGTNWAASGIADRRPIGPYRATIWYPEQALEESQRHEEFELLVSFYGPQAEDYASLLHDNALVWQNRSELWRVGLKLVELHDSRRAPELVKNQWLNRVDKEITFRRIIRRFYKIFPLVGARGVVATESYHVPIKVP